MARGASKLRQLLEFDQEIKTVCQQSRQLSLSDLSSTDHKFEIALVGLDEVGRGCLAGPVVAAAVSLPEIDPKSAVAQQLQKLNDSKALTPAERQELANTIKAVSTYAIAESSVDEIDEINILQSSLLAMKRARKQLCLVSPVVLLVDGNKKIPGMRDCQITVVKGDAKSASIAAASIIAKVYRDELMQELSALFPVYRWNANKGYASEQHRMAIKEHGLTPVHRKSFRTTACDKT